MTLKKSGQQAAGTIVRSPPTFIPEAVVRYIFESITRACLTLPLMPEFAFDRLGDEKTPIGDETGGDATCHVIVGEIATYVFV